MAKHKDYWGPIASSTEIADQIGAIEKATDMVHEAQAELSRVSADARAKIDRLKKAKNELGRMLKSRNDFDDSDFRVVHRDEVSGSPSHELFGIYSVRE